MRALARRVRGERGSVLVEFTVILPVVLLVVIGGFVLFWFATARSALTDAAREAVRFASIPHDPLECALEPCTGTWPSVQEVEDHVKAEAETFGVDDVDVSTTGVGNGVITVTVGRRVPDPLRPLAGVFGIGEVYSVTVAEGRYE